MSVLISVVLGLDTLPLLLGIAIYVPFWPGRILTPASKVTPRSSVSASPSAEPGVVDGEVAREVDPAMSQADRAPVATEK